MQIGIFVIHFMMIFDGFKKNIIDVFVEPGEFKCELVEHRPSYSTYMYYTFDHSWPVVQSIVRLTTLLRRQLVKYEGHPISSDNDLIK